MKSRSVQSTPRPTECFASTDNLLRLKTPPDVVVALAFGTGNSNSVLAEVTNSCSTFFRVPILCQREVLQYLDSGHKRSRVEVLQGPEGAYLDTYRALCETKAICEKRGWTKVLLVAHPDHMPRAIRVARALGLDAEAAPIGDVPYDRSSSQWWTRRRLLFRLWSLAAKAYYSIRNIV